MTLIATKQPPSYRSTASRPTQQIVVIRRRLPAKQTRRRFWRKPIPRKTILLACVAALFLPLFFFSRPGATPTLIVYAEGAPAGAGGPEGVVVADSGNKPKSNSKAKNDPVSAAKGANLGGRSVSGTILFHGRKVDYQLVQPVIDNRAAFGKYFPNGTYTGDVGDRSHQNANPPQDHTPGASGNYNGARPKAGFIYAQDFGSSEDSKSDFDRAGFIRWLIPQLKAGKYPEIKYVISRENSNQGTAYYGIMMRRNGWHAQAASGHADHVHVSYMMEYNGVAYERVHSTIIRDYACSIGRC